MEEKIGKVLICGGGISGMQAALDLANSGFKVYLLESQTAIGGRMVRLDKTFPTGDCAMCTIAPRLVECGQNSNIQIVTSAEIESIKGVPGDFDVQIKRNPTFVDEVKCTACGECEKVCPVEIEDFFDEGLSSKKAIYKLYPQAIPNLYAIEKRGISPCRLGCPAGVNAHGYVALISEGKYKEAMEKIRETNPFVGTCGMICTHPCEDECSRGEIDTPVAICALKRFVFESVDDELQSAQSLGDFGYIDDQSNVAIIGSGPTGLSCAYHLRKRGYQTTVFEALSFPGGMLQMAIPDFRLPKKVVDRDIEYIKNTGVEIRLNTRVGKDVSFTQLREEYSAIFIAPGAPKPRKLEVPGISDETLTGVMFAIDFLKDIKLGKRVEVGSKVTVVGGGNTALDSARCAKRSGADEVTIIYRRSSEEMPAIPEEIELARDEGIEIMYLAAPKKINGSQDKVNSIECIKMRLGEEDESGRRRPIPVEGSEFTLPVDTVIIAIGQYSDLSFLPEEIEFAEGGNIVVEPETLATNVPGIFAGGDVITGPDILIKAIAAGRKAAVSIDRYLKGEELIPVTLLPVGEKAELKDEKIEKRKRLSLFQESGRKGIENLEEMAKKEAERCLNCGVCSECLECVKVCEPEAIDHLSSKEVNEEKQQLNVGAVILTGGYEPFDARLKGEYGYKRFENVVTSVEFERILSPSGPSEGEIVRPSDESTPKRIAFIQCVGSRDSTVNRDYCSAVCCMYATKEAIVTKEHFPNTEVCIFFIDLRAYGKGYEEYYQRAKEEYGINYIRCQLSRTIEMPKTKNLLVRYFKDNQIKEKEFDLVVLSVGLQPSESMAELCERTEIMLDDYGFCHTEHSLPLHTSRDGIYVAGCFQGPKDIPESVTQGSGTASMAMELLEPARHSLTVKREYPPEREVSEEKPKIGVFICHCGKNIASVVEVKKLAQIFREMENVAFAETLLYACSPDGLTTIRKKIDEHKLNRVIVASCTPRTHELLFQENLRESGLNPYLFEMANIRDQCSWVHYSTPQKATEKAEDLIRMAVGKALYLKPLETQLISVTKEALVIGGGLSGMTTAISLARQNVQVHLVEKAKELGGQIRKLYYTLQMDDVGKFLKGYCQQIELNPNIHVYTETEVKEVSGAVGNFSVTLRAKSRCESESRRESVSNYEHSSIECGVIVVATGAQEYKPKEYLYGEDERVVTQRELEKQLSLSSPSKFQKTSTVVMIQCVGSRNSEHPYCSRICCSEAIKNALRLKELNPEVEVFILYRDVRTYGLREIYYHNAREAGVVFIRYEEDEEPKLLKEEQSLRVKVEDQSIDQELIIETDMVVLSTGVVPEAFNSELGSLLKVPLNEDGFFLEKHMKLNPVEFPTEGIFLCGTAHSPKFMDESIAQSEAVSAKAMTILSKEYLEVGGVVAKVDEDKCIACLTCVRSCPYDVPVINSDGVAEVDSSKCEGCGICVAECPAKAINLQQFEDKQILKMGEELASAYG